MKHANIVKVREVFREDNKLYFVFEYMKQNLYEMLKSRYHNMLGMANKTYRNIDIIMNVLVLQYLSIPYIIDVSIYNTLRVRV